MIRINEQYLKLQTSYLFADIKKRMTDFQERYPGREMIKLGIGDVTRGLPRACVEAMQSAVAEMADEDTFRGYGPEQGYAFLREKIAGHEYQARGVGIEADEIFVSDGAKCDTGNFQEILAGDAVVALPDPVYPVYLDANVMAGRAGTFADGRYTGIVYLDCTEANNFMPDLPGEQVDIIYLCFPNNPTGAMIDKEGLRKWVDFARKHKALILYDAAYEIFIQDPDLPRSIFEVEGAGECAVEFRSYSKTAGFTGTRCAYTVVPKDCRAFTSRGEPVSLHDLWLRRQSTKFNGASYPVQRAAEAVYTPAGQEQIKERIEYYLANAQLLKQSMESLGFQCAGGLHSPYIWINGRRDAWDFFDLLLHEAGVVCTPGVGFGSCGQGYIRLSAFNTRENVRKAVDRIQDALA